MSLTIASLASGRHSKRLPCVRNCDACVFATVSVILVYLVQWAYFGTVKRTKLRTLRSRDILDIISSRLIFAQSISSEQWKTFSERNRLKIFQLKWHTSWKQSYKIGDFISYTWQSKYCQVSNSAALEISKEKLSKWSNHSTALCFLGLRIVNAFLCSIPDTKPSGTLRKDHGTLFMVRLSPEMVAAISLRNELLSNCRILPLMLQLIFSLCIHGDNHQW